MAMMKPDPGDKRTRSDTKDTVAIPVDHYRPVQVGPFHILELLGIGGTGEVYLAEQKSPIKRRVALKLIKAGMDTREVIARFESERQALAMMNHPNVARIFDAGCTDQGRPYFVMEYVPGEAITDYCDHYKLSLRQRLELFVDVCQAIQHAHQKGIIHRDIKPSNIIVEAGDKNPTPKVIDFGVAKATQYALTEKTVYTVKGLLVGTPAYMSPEQAEMSGCNVDTTSDVYSLGVLLYELLTGVQPFDAKQLQAAGVAEIHRIIRDVNPPKPSSRVGENGSSSASSARRCKQLRGDLDSITMHAMDKEQTRRYQSASELANDVKRYLQGHPVLAKPPSAAYQLKKLVFRHKTRCVLLAMMMTLIVGSSVTVSFQTNKISRERDRANNGAETARQISEFLVNLFTLSDPNQSNGNTVTAREILDAGVVRIDRELLDQPLVRAQLMQTMGDVYVSLALHNPARSLLEDALTANRKLLGENHIEVANSMNSLAALLSDMGDYEQALPLARKALAIREHKLGPDHPDVATTLQIQAGILSHTSDFSAARALDERALAIRENALGKYHPDVAQTLTHLANVLRETGDFKQSRLLLERALTINERALGRHHPEVASTLESLANLLRHDRDYDGARALFKRSLAIKEHAFGVDHPEVATTLNNYAILLREIHDFDGARQQYERALGIVETALGPDHPSVAFPLNNLASVFIDTGDYEAARPLCLRAIRIREKALGPEHPYVATTLQNLASVLSHTGDSRGARQLFERALAINEKALGGQHPKVAANLFNLADMLKDSGQYKEAQPYFSRALSIMEATLSPEHPYIALVTYKMACNAALDNDRGEALNYLQKYLTTSGYAEASLDTESDLASLRGDPQFRLLTDRWRSSQ